MIKRILGLIIALCVLNTAFAQITYKNGIGGGATVSGSGIVTTGTLNATVATSLNALVVVHLSNFSGAGALVSPSSSGVMGDSKGNTYNIASARSQGAFGRSSIWYTTGPSTIVDAAMTWTSNLASSSPSIDVEIFYGYGTFSLDREANNGVVTATSGSTGSITPLFNGEVIVTGMCDVGRTVAPTVTPGAITTYSTFVGSTKYSGAMAMEILAAGSGVPYSSTYSFGSAQTACLQVVSFNLTPGAATDDGSGCLILLEGL